MLGEVAAIIQHLEAIEQGKQVLVRKCAFCRREVVCSPHVGKQGMTQGFYFLKADVDGKVKDPKPHNLCEQGPQQQSQQQPQPNPKHVDDMLNLIQRGDWVTLTQTRLNAVGPQLETALRHAWRLWQQKRGRVEESQI